MKKILIVNNNMHVGGVQKSLYNLLWTLKDQYEITLLLFRASGAYADQLPPWVRVVECDSLFRYLGVSQGECVGIDRLKRGALAGACRVLGRPAVMKVILPSQRMLREEYDCAIAFLHNGNEKNFYGGVQEFVLNKVNACKKVAFLHCDFLNCGANMAGNRALLERFDRIAACSDGCRSAFCFAMPELAERCVTVRNFHRIEEIQSFAQEAPVVYTEECCNIVMVSRLAHEKGIERAIEAVANAINDGANAVLHIVGGGPAETVLRQRAAELGIEMWVRFYGEQSNPYRYMKNADLFLLTSFHEAAPMVIEEARCLALPVLTMRTTSSREMVEQEECGWVCENNQQALNQALSVILMDEGALKAKKMCIRNLDNSVAEEQFRNLIEG